MVTCNQLICALVFPYLDYANSLLFSLPQHLIDKLQRVQNAADRIVTRASHTASSRPLLKRLHLLPVDKRIEYKIAILAYKCVNGIAPGYLSELVSISQPARALRSNYSIDLVIP